MTWKNGNRAVSFVLTHSITFSLCLCLCISLGGCISGSMRAVNISTDLPGDLPQDLKTRFEVKETERRGSENSVSATPEVTREPQNLKPLTRAQRRAARKAAQNAAHAEKLAQAAHVPFVYPSRRPEKNPIWLSERLVFGIYYFGVAAGEFNLEVLPFKTIQDRKVYHIRGHAVTTPVFSLFYRLNDIVETFFDFEGSFSHRFHVLIDESKQKRDAIELNDSEKKQTYYWNRVERKDAPYAETKEYGTIEAFSQDSLSSLYYIRTVPLEVGKTFSFPVVSEGKSWEALCTVLRQEEINTSIGRVKTWVIKPQMKVGGEIKNKEDSFLWVTDDERRIPVKLEAKVKVGTVVAKLWKFEGGSPPEVIAKPLTQEPLRIPSTSSSPGIPSPEKTKVD